MVYKGWRETTRRLCKAEEMLRIRVPVWAQVGLVGSVLQKCLGLVNISLRIESGSDGVELVVVMKAELVDVVVVVVVGMAVVEVVVLVVEMVVDVEVLEEVVV
ncbi:unnamed protein product [Prunus armeniaca]